MIPARRFVRARMMHFFVVLSVTGVMLTLYLFILEASIFRGVSLPHRWAFMAGFLAVVIVAIHAILVKAPFYGPWMYAGESMGLALALYIVYEPSLPKLLIAFVIGWVASFVGALLRVKRLKKRGYVA
jgi:magnesium-transporting ATPase (P-type)